MPISNPNPNYLPVLLVSVSTNAAPDDNFVTQRPRGQVDYLSHEWQEEDVWRSWRNMTRQKNEIANGVRLENASWRTWWKQRNKLPTVSPETLNWLKDSDVTWLYGPLHTATDEKPQRPPGIPPSTPNTTEAPPRTTKPILKYRSITELLTSDLPTSPVFTPPESEDEPSRSPSPPAVKPGTSAPSPGIVFKRPQLLHTKSDTHITRWGPNRAYRKDSPPRIEPPGHAVQDGYFPHVSADGAVRSSLSQDSNSSAGNSTERTGKKKHISFNTFVEQVIAIDQPKRSASFYGAGERWDPSRRTYDDDDGYEEDLEDSAEDESSPHSVWNRQHLHDRYHHPEDIDEEGEDGIIEMRSSFRNATPKKTLRSQSKASTTSSSSSVSTASSSTASSTTNSANSSSSPTRDSVSLSSASTARRKPLSRRTSASTYRPLRGVNPEHIHVTIAPIAPTVLKTEIWEEGFGDDGAGSDDGFGWREPLWNQGVDGKGKGRASRGRGKTEDDGSDASGTPVELVYVPPFSGRYAYGFDGYDEDEDEDDEGDFGAPQGLDDEYLDIDYVSMHASNESAASAVYLHRETAAGSVGFEDYEATEPHPSTGHRFVSAASPYPPPTSTAGIPIPILDDSEREHVDYIDPTPQNPDVAASPIPKLVVEYGARIPSVEEEDENDFFDGDADYGNEYMQRSRAGPRAGYVSRNRKFLVGSASSGTMDERPSRSTSRTTSERSRSKSYSRTPSPAIDAIVAASVDSSASRSNLRRTNSASAGSPSSLCPPGRGRSQVEATQSGTSLGRSYSAGSLQTEGTRGRSSSRASSNAASSIESSLSPFAGSPDATGSRTARGGSAYAGSGRGDKERRGREPTKERERGRDRTTDKRLSVSLSASPEPPRSVKRESSSATDVTASTSSASSSRRTVMPDGAEEETVDVSTPQPQQPPSQPQPQEEKPGRKRMTADDYQRKAEDLLRRAHPTPSNSPILEMRTPQLPSSHSRPPSSASTSASSSRCNSGAETPTKQSVAAAASTPTPSKIAASRPPPTLISSPTSPVQPSTSEYTATSSPLKGGPVQQNMVPNVGGAPVGHSTPSPSSSSPSESVGEDTDGSLKDVSKKRSKSLSTERSPNAESSLIGKAHEMVSNAGAFLGWWNHA